MKQLIWGWCGRGNGMVFSLSSTTNLEINELTHLDPFVYFQIRCTRGDKSPHTITSATPPKPEPLKYELSGCWSRRIDKKHRLVYRFDGHTVYILQARHHYSD